MAVDGLPVTGSRLLRRSGGKWGETRPSGLERDGGGIGGGESGGGGGLGALAGWSV